MNNKPQISLSKGSFKNEPVVFIDFDFDWKIVNLIRLVPNAVYFHNEKKWYILEKNFSLNKLTELLEGKILINSDKLKPETTIPKEYLELLKQKRYSENTIKTYVHYFEDFANYFQSSELAKITTQQINAYILELIETKNISVSQQNQRINSIKFYYEKVLGRQTEYYTIERPRQEKKLPDVLSKGEIAALLKATENKKHKAIIALIYSCGLRRSETINIKIDDIDSQRMLIKIKGAKGKKDRYVQLSPNVLPLLRDHYKIEKPSVWIFEGAKGKQYSEVSIYNIVKKAARKAGIRKRVYPHILRHSYATHHLEQGTDLRYIQEWLGHDSSKTTEIYTHVTNSSSKKFKNPFDDIPLD